MRNNIEETPDHLWHVEIRDSTRRYDDASFDTFEEALEWIRRSRTPSDRNIKKIEHREGCLLRQPFFVYHHDKTF